jgi:predicted enzyme related to lactoylglutathione lyase
MIGNHHLSKILLLSSLLMAASSAIARGPAYSPPPQVGVGAQYDTTHVYVKAADFDQFVNSFTSTLGGKASPRIPSTLTPTPSKADFQYVWTPVGTLSTFAFSTPIPYPFGLERTGWLVTDMDLALKAARDNGAKVIVDKWPDPIGYDAIIQWPGGIKMQLYWHSKAPKYDPLEAVPETRTYVSRDDADAFITSIVGFSHGKVVSDEPRAPGVEIGRPNETYRRIRIESVFGKMTVFVTDGHLPYPYGIELTGYEVADLKDTLTKATRSGATVLVEPFTSERRDSAIVQFPGGYIAEIHAPAK